MNGGTGRSVRSRRARRPSRPWRRATTPYAAPIDSRFISELSPGIYDELLRTLRPAGLSGAPVAVTRAVRPGQVSMIDAVAGGGFTSATRPSFAQLGREDVKFVAFVPPLSAALELVWREDASAATHALLALAEPPHDSSPIPSATSHSDHAT